VLVDDGLSRNGTYVNGERVAGRRRLRDGDAVRIGSTHLVYRSPAQQRVRATEQAAGGLSAGSISATQRRILIALCRPFRDGEPFATTPSNRVIADEVALSVARVSTLNSNLPTGSVGSWIPRDRELDFALGELLDDVARVGQRAREPIELGHDERVAMAARRHRLAQPGRSR
jgi:hypothetical protein